MKKKVVKLNESHLTNIIKKVIRENTEERELNLRNKLNDIFFGNDSYNLTSDPGEFGYLSQEHRLSKKISPKQINARINNVIKLLNYYADRIKDGLLDYNNDSKEYDNNWGSYEQNDTEGINELFGFGGFKKESVYPYIGELKELLLPRTPLTIEMAEKAPNSINKFNKIVDDIKADKGIVNKMGKKGISLKPTLGTDQYGINRASNNYNSDMNDLYLGNVGGLNTKALPFWIENIDDAEVANIIGKQLYGWVNGNIDHVIEVLTSLTKD